jgi:hypothetical protein
MFKPLALAAGVLLAILMFTGCDDGPTNPAPFVVPTVYDSTGWTANTAVQYQIRNNLQALITLVRSARKTSVTLSADQTAGAFAPLRPLTNTADQARIDGLLLNAANASGGTYDWTKAPSEAGNGGVYVTYLFDQYGRDVDEFVQKGLFNTMLYHQATIILDAPMTPASVDQVVALFGANPAFPNGSTSAAQRDVLVANYAARRDKNDGVGFYTRFRDAALKAKAAAAKPGTYGAELSEANRDMREIWERSQMATAINYMYAVIAGLSATSVTDSARASAMHAFGEGAGIIRGWKSVPATKRIITDAQLDVLLELLYLQNDASPTCHQVWQNPVASLPRLEQVLQNIKAAYSFSNAEMDDFKSNWVSVQGR